MQNKITKEQGPFVSIKKASTHVDELYIHS